MNTEHFRPEFQHAFSADKLEALGVAEHLPFSVKVSVEANRKSQRSEKLNNSLLYTTRVR